jgi:multicomponent Na+:H+ antiporter subunit D
MSFQMVSHIGYMLMGLGLFTPLALAGSVFYMAHHMIVITSLFLVSGVVQQLLGTSELPKLGGCITPMQALLSYFSSQPSPWQGCRHFPGLSPNLPWCGPVSNISSP